MLRPDRSEMPGAQTVRRAHFTAKLNYPRGLNQVGNSGLERIEHRELRDVLVIYEPERRTKRVPLNPPACRLMMCQASRRKTHMAAANQVVLYFENQEDALRFTLAAGSVLADQKPNHTVEDLMKVAREMVRASRITAKGTLNP